MPSSASVADVIDGLEGDDVLNGGAGNDILNGGEGDDHIVGGDGDDVIDGGDGDDVIDGGDGADIIYGNDGDDTIYLGVGDALQIDSVVQNVGGNGYDTAIMGEGFSWNTGNWSWYGFEAVVGNSSVNVINGLDGNVGYNFQGGGGDDTITTSGGDDTLDGGTGDDVLTGKAGDDHFTGGAGADVFVFADGFGDDTVSDFEVGTLGEALDLAAVSAIADYTDLIANHMS